MTTGNGSSTLPAFNQAKVDAAKTTKSITPEQAEIARLQAQLAAATKRIADLNKPGVLRLNVGEKGGISILGLQGFPVTLYAHQLMRVLQMRNSIREFMTANWDKLSFAHKDGSPAPEQATEVEEWLAGE